jgi:hypothetical protein
MNLRKEVELLKQQLVKRDTIIAELQRRITELEKHNADLERRLLAYENAHTPPSAALRKRKKDDDDDEKRGKGIPPGRKPGHEGSTRILPEPDDTVEVKLERCPECGSAAKHLEELPYVESKTIIDIPKAATCNSAEVQAPSLRLQTLRDAS